MDLTIACADVGSIEQGNFGWALRDLPDPLEEDPHHASIDEFAAAICERLNGGRSVALGFECPLFVPLRNDPTALGRARRGEGNRPWSAGAGAGSLVTGLVQTTWILSRLRTLLEREPPVTLSWSEIDRRTPSLFLWEAFVSRNRKAATHHGDAALAVNAFCDALPDPRKVNMIHEDGVLSLIGAALLRAGWNVPIDVLSTPCLVIEALELP